MPSDAWAVAAQIFERRALTADPVAWAKKRCGVHLWSVQRDIARSVAANKRTAVQSAHGVGKALALDTPLPTPTGWTTMGAIQPGDLLFDEQGKPCTVVAVSPVWHRPAYRVTFCDGSQLTASGEHMWNVLDLAARRHRRVADWRDHWALADAKTTAELATSPRTKCGQSRWRIPCAGPVQGNHITFPAYSLGAWLGDGTTVTGAITVSRDDAANLVTQIEADGFKTRFVPSADRETTRLCRVLGLSEWLRTGSMLGNKHIPQWALRASREERLALLQGLMDTDGSVHHCGRLVTFEVTSARLADGVAELICTMGWKVHRSTKRATLYGKDCGPVYRLNFSPDEPVFRLPRKLASWDPKEAQASRHTQRTIRSVEPVGIVAAKCVQVDSPSSLYLAGESFIPTHNSFLAACLAGWWVDTHPADQTMVVSTAPSLDQVHAILWEEIRILHDRAGLPGVVQRTDRWIVGDRLVGMGRKPPDYSESAFQGLHKKYTLVILDEACGIPSWLWTAVETITTADTCRILAIGNPDDPNSHFKRLCTEAPNWSSFQISVFDSPNFTDEEVPDDLRQLLTSQQWVSDRRDEWGEDNPLYIAKVLGQFPTDHPWSVVRLSDVYACRLPGTPRVRDELLPVQLGIDVGGGGDETVIRERRGMVAAREWREHSDKPETVARLVLHAIRESNATSLKVDSIGLGAGLVGELRNLRELGAHTATVHAVNVSERAKDPLKYFNLRSQLWWECGRIAAEQRAFDLSVMENADKTVAQMLEPRYTHDMKGRIKVEPKDDIIKRLGRSPDNADALLLAFYEPHASSNEWFEELLNFGYR